MQKTATEFRKFLGSSEKTGKDLIRRAVTLHSLGAEKKFLKDLFSGNEIPENNFRYLLGKINRQIDRVSRGKSQLSKGQRGVKDYDIFEKIFMKSYNKSHTLVDVFIRNRARKVIIRQVKSELESLSQYNLGFSAEVFADIIEFYNEMYQKADEKIQKIFAENPTIAENLDEKLCEKSLFALEQKMVHDMHDKGIISGKLYAKFQEEIEHDFYSDVEKELRSCC